MTTHSMAHADPVILELEMMCPFPLIGDQPVMATITADYPAEVSVGEPLGPVMINTLTRVNDASRQGLAMMEAKTLSGKATSIATLTTASRNEEKEVALNIDSTPIPEEKGDFDVPATGEAPVETFTADDVGPAQITINDLILDLTSLKEDGSPVEGPVGQFTSDCTIVEGQKNVLHSFNVVDGGPGLPQDIQVDPKAIEFGDVQLGTSSQMDVKVVNAGGAMLGINGVEIAGANAQEFVQMNTCTTLGSGESCNINVTYAASTEGMQTAELIITSDDPDSPSVTVPMSGNGQMEPAADIELSETEIDFGGIDVGSTSERTLTISNVGGAALNISNIALANNADFFVVGTDCSILEPKASCAVNLSFTANSEMPSSDTLTIESDDPDEAMLTVALTGSGKDSGDPTQHIGMDADGSTYVAASGGTLPLAGAIEGELDLATGMLSADVTLEPTTGTFQVSKIFRQLVATTAVEFEPVEKTTGTLINGLLTANSQVYVKVPSVTVNVFGLDLPIGGGESCRTIDPVNISISTPEGETFEAMNGGSLEGSYDLPVLENCGPLTSVLNQLMAGSDNRISLDLKPQM
ncbi:choice-of-anchor D domain-containing protein [Hahella ganghwensis]|uniref:choice-of-anchor D domain-containing protein n=1 Tax=Hahella ganghwensis TaxID=286420 RepID=UPI0012FB77A4|nr:choice-of-anchor D domain-containing protein [Hahella ganghwensis]